MFKTYDFTECVHGGVQLVGREELSNYIQKRIGVIDISITEIARQSGLARAEIYKILNCEVQASVDTLRRLSIPLRVHNFQLIRALHADYLRPLCKEGRPSKYRTYESAWVRDVTHPDNTVVSTGQQFTKVWEIQNTGEETWEGFYLKNVNFPFLPGNLVPEYDKYPLPKVEPGQTTQIRIKFRAPPFAGTVISRWKMFDSDDQMVFPDKNGIWCQVQVEVIDM